MDFNTGGSGGQNPNDPSRPLFGAGGPSGPGPSRGPVGGGGGEFTLSDPVGSFVRTVQAIVTNPVGFFRGMNRRGDFVSPLVFAVICAAVYGILAGIIGFLINLVAGNGFGAALGTLFGNAIGAPIGMAVGLFIGAGIFHLLVLIFVRPSNAGFEATFRVVAYASVALLVSWLAVIPILGILISIVVGIYSIFLNVIGIREAHATTTGRAVAIVLIPAAIVFVLAILVGGALLLVLLGSR